MNMSLTTKRTAMLLSLAVLCLLLLVVGCATKRDIKEVNQRLARIEANRQVESNVVERVDSLLAQVMESNRAVRTDVRVSIDDMQAQLDALLNNYNDLMVQLSAIRQELQSRQILRGSTGGTGMPADTFGTEEPMEPGMPPTTPGVNCDSTYDEAFVLALQENYDPAIEGFREFLAKCPSDESVPDAYFWIGESYFRTEKFAEAEKEFQHVVDTYPESPKYVLALYKLGRSKQELGQKDDARKLFQRVVDEFPDAMEAKQAQDRLNELK
jgi:tol-pal system protein YbgF